MEQRYLGIKDLAQYLGITEGTLYTWVCYKKIPHIKMGRLVKFDLREIEVWVRENAVQAQ